MKAEEEERLRQEEEEKRVAAEQRREERRLKKEVCVCVLTSLRHGHIAGLLLHIFTMKTFN